MKTGNVTLMGIALLYAAKAFAQETQRVEVSVDYSYLRFNPQIPNGAAAALMAEVEE